MNELKQAIEKVNTKGLWLVMYNIAKCFSEIEPTQADDNQMLFWYALYKVVEREIDKRTEQED